MVVAGHMLVKQDENNPSGLETDVNGHIIRFMKSCMVLVGGMNSNGKSFVLHWLFVNIPKLFHLSADSHNHIKIWRERCSWSDGSFKVNFGNISEKFHNDETPYDFGSVMHYSPTACAIDKNLPVITKQDGSPLILNKTDTFSSWDIEQINHIYNCDINNLKPKGEYCIKIQSNCHSDPNNTSFLGLYHNNIKIKSIPVGFEDFEYCLPRHWVDVQNDTFKLQIDTDADKTLKNVRYLNFCPSY